jgi:hypothetical protein
MLGIYIKLLHLAHNRKQPLPQSLERPSELVEVALEKQSEFRVYLRNV